MWTTRCRCLSPALQLIPGETLEVLASPPTAQRPGPSWGTPGQRAVGMLRGIKRAARGRLSLTSCHGFVGQLPPGPAATVESDDLSDQMSGRGRAHGTRLRRRPPAGDADAGPDGVRQAPGAARALRGQHSGSGHPCGARGRGHTAGACPFTQEPQLSLPPWQAPPAPDIGSWFGFLVILRSSLSCEGENGAA